MRCIIAEKPSVALDIARTLGAPQKHEGYVTVGDDVVTWAYGHLATLADPEHYHPEWKRWDWATLPMLPETFQLMPIPKTQAQLRIITRLCRQADRIIAATDADREGQYIFATIARVAGLSQPVDRLWLSENTPTAIRKALETMKPNTAYDHLTHAAEARAQADWLVGLNATRAFSLRHGEPGYPVSVGRVQTPTLRLIADRDQAIESFQSTPYWQVAVTFHADAGDYPGVWQGHDPDHPDRIADPGTAAAVLAHIKPGMPGVITALERKPVTRQSPLLFSLNDLQKEANRRFGLTAQQTLDAAQALYDQHLTSYPRTDSRHITHDIADTLADRLKGLRTISAYAPLLELLPRPMGTGRLVNDAQVAEVGHYAIIPTGQTPTGTLSGAEGQIYDLICRRLVAALLPAGQDERTTLMTEANGQVFKTTGTRVIQTGWRAAWQPALAIDEEEGEDPSSIPAGLRPGEAVTVQTAEIVAKETQAAPRLTDASLLGLMEQHGLGTPATRARIIEVLLRRQYVERKKKTLHTTTKGQKLLAVVPDSIQSPDMTGHWEARLEAIAAGKEEVSGFMQAIRQYTKDLVATAQGQKTTTLAGAMLGSCPQCHQGTVAASPRGWSCSRWKEGCPFTIWRDVAGKKLTVPQVKALVAGKTTAEIQGFKNRAGKTFTARLTLNPETWRVDFVFDAAGNTRKTNRSAG